MAVTMRDVAQKAGVSIKTVSRVVNDQGEISESARQRVPAVIQEMGCRPGKVAHALVMGDITYTSFFSEMVLLQTSQENAALFCKGFII